MKCNRLILLVFLSFILLVTGCQAQEVEQEPVQEDKITYEEWLIQEEKKLDEIGKEIQKEYEEWYSENDGILKDFYVDEEDETKQGVTLGMENAKDTAQSYIDNLGGFSKERLIEQLKYEGYTDNEANYAVNNIVVNWKEQCAMSARSYLDYSSFSRSGLYDQLEYEGFTHEEIEYGLKAVGY